MTRESTRPTITSAGDQFSTTWRDVISRQRCTGARGAQVVPDRDLRQTPLRLPGPPCTMHVHAAGSVRSVTLAVSVWLRSSAPGAIDPVETVATMIGRPGGRSPRLAEVLGRRPPLPPTNPPHWRRAPGARSVVRVRRSRWPTGTSWAYGAARPNGNESRGPRRNRCRLNMALNGGTRQNPPAGSVTVRRAARRTPARCPTGGKRQGR